jgi:hypothetical protein
MRYLLLLYQGEVPSGTEIPADVMQNQLASYAAFTKDVRERGIFQAGEALEPTTTATTVRVRDGQTTVTDGPFAETKEALGGFYLLECQDLDEAVELAARIPSAARGSVEIRPIWELPPDYGTASAAQPAGATT